MNSEYNSIYESYKKQVISEMTPGRDAIGYGQQRSRQLYSTTPKNDTNNSFGGVSSTSQLPGGTDTKISPAGIGASVSIDEEERFVKGFGKMSKADLHVMYDKILNQIRQLKASGKTGEIKAKVELLNTLTEYL